MSIYNDKLYALNRFKAHMIPSARALWQKYGPSLMAHRSSGHPDNTDPYHFNVPNNISGILPNTGGLALGSAIADANAQVMRENAASSEVGQSEDGASASEEHSDEG